MRRSLFALFRGSDGRSLARALAALLFVNALFGGLHGAMLANAATNDAPVLCSLAADPGAPAAPANDDHSPCCLAGCASSLAPMVAPASPALADAPAMLVAIQRPRSAEFATPFRFDPPSGPRGPPFLG